MRDHFFYLASNQIVKDLRIRQMILRRPIECRPRKPLWAQPMLARTSKTASPNSIGPQPKIWEPEGTSSEGGDQGAFTSKNYANPVLQPATKPRRGRTSPAATYCHRLIYQTLVRRASGKHNFFLRGLFPGCKCFRKERFVAVSPS